MDPLLSPAQAEEHILEKLPRLPVGEAALADARRHILARPLVADRPLPPYDRVMMDGIAFRAADASAREGRLRVAGLHAAGAPAPDPLPEGSCWEIMTGAVLPADCDAVVPYEEVTRDGEHAVVDQKVVSPGRHVHAMGSDFQPGAELVPAGTRLGAREMAVAATVGAVSVPVVTPPRITIVTTGDELVPPEAAPEPHQVRRSNGISLAAALANWGAARVRTVHLPDDEAATVEGLRSALDASDLVLVCGGISRGKRDFVRPALEQLIGAPVFHGVAQRPGKPLAFWKGTPPLFALPGNPMSVLVCFHRYVLPALAAMSGTPWKRRTLPLASAVEFKPPLTFFVPVTLTTNHQADPTPTANSGDFATAIASHGFIELPPDHAIFPPGTTASYQGWL